MGLKPAISEKQPKIIEHFTLSQKKKKKKKKIVHYIKCGKSAKKHPKNVKLKFLTMEDIFG